MKTNQIESFLEKFEIITCSGSGTGKKSLSSLFPTKAVFTIRKTNGQLSPMFEGKLNIRIGDCISFAKTSTRMFIAKTPAGFKILKANGRTKSNSFSSAKIHKSFGEGIFEVTDDYIIEKKTDIAWYQVIKIGA